MIPSMTDDLNVGESHQCFVQDAIGGLIDERWCSRSHVPLLLGFEGEGHPDHQLPAELTLFEDERLSVVFTPFDCSNRSAKVILVGLTPGRFQLDLALRQAGTSLRAGKPLDDAVREAKSVAAFAGATRTNLVSMLDGIGLHDALGIDSSESLFGEDSALADSTSAICHAVFVKDRNYSGSPPIASHPILRAAASQVLTANLAATPEAVVIPLGRAAASGVAIADVDPKRVVLNFPHPSGGNGHRSRQFAAEREALREVIAHWFA